MKKTCRNCINYKYCSHSYGILLDQVECDCRDFVPVIESYEGAPGKEISASESSCKTCGYYKQCKDNYETFMNIHNTQRTCYAYEPKKSNATNSMAGPHKVESKITNFDRELQKVKVEELAYLRSHWTPCEDCPLVDECVKDELTCLDLWVRYLKETVK